MKSNQLPLKAQQKLGKLLKEVEKILNASKTPHTHAVSVSYIVHEGGGEMLKGGNLRAPAAPQFDYDELALAELHEAILKDAEDTLSRIIVSAERTDPKAKWTVEAKLVSRSEHLELAKARKPIDLEIEELLREYKDGKTWDRVAFGISTQGAAPRLLRNGPKGIEKLKPTPELLALMKRTQDLYKREGHELVIGSWNLRKTGLDFEEYFE